MASFPFAVGHEIFQGLLKGFQARRAQLEIFYCVEKC
jgi:hypothetical protein